MKCSYVQFGQLVSAKTLWFLKRGRELYLKDQISGISWMAGGSGLFWTDSNYVQFTFYIFL